MKLDDKIPETVDEAVQKLFDALTDTDRAHILNIPPGAIHHTFGRHLRNHWGMWADGPLRRDFQARFKLFGHADDMSGLILETLWTRVLGENVESAQAKHIEMCRRHWLQVGVNPETGEKIGA